MDDLATEQSDFSVDFDETPTPMAGEAVEFDQPAGDESATAQPPVVADQSPGAAAQATQNPGTPPGTSDADRVRALEAQLRQMQQGVMPYVQAMQERTRQAAVAPPVSRQAIEDGTATPAQFLAYLEWQNQQNAAAYEQRAAQASLRQASEMQARGMFTAAAFNNDPNFAYDSMHARYLAPAYMTNPSLRDAVSQIAPDAPAQGEFLLATLFHALEQNGNDPVRTARQILGQTQQVQDLKQRVQQAQARQADRIVSGATAATAKGRGYDPNDPNAFSRMSDDEFNRFALGAGA